ncbi:uncharacterized protein [Temnothorax longispinosus]
MLLSTEPSSQLIPVNIVTRPSLSLRPRSNNCPGPNELPDDDDAVVIEVEVTELAYVTTTSTTSAPIKTDRHESGAIMTAVSLGLPCIADLECRMADPMSRCINGVCDCSLPTALQRAADRLCQARSSAGHPVAASAGSSSATAAPIAPTAPTRSAPVLAARSSRSDATTVMSAYRGPDCATATATVFAARTRSAATVGENVPRARSDATTVSACRQPAYEFCNAVVCRDGSDEPRGTCRTRNRGRITSRYCPFRCDNGRCRSDAILAAAGTSAAMVPTRNTAASARTSVTRSKMHVHQLCRVKRLSQTPLIGPQSNQSKSDSNVITAEKYFLPFESACQS